MSRLCNRTARRTTSPRALVVTAALLGAAALTVAPGADAQVLPAAAPMETSALTLENAAPLPVPPPPRLQTPKPVKAPPRFTAPQPIEPPPLPSLAGIDPVPPPPPVPGAPPVQATAPSKPPPAPIQAAPSQPSQTAALPPPSAPAQPRAVPGPALSLSVVFDGAATDLPTASEPGLTEVAERLRADETLRLQLRSYASGTPETAREARQLSLARALAVRERLTAFGIRSTRIDIRALGAGAADGPPDRIDVEFLN